MRTTGWADDRRENEARPGADASGVVRISPYRNETDSYAPVKAHVNFSSTFTVELENG
jgi:hypothetical protein